MRIQNVKISNFRRLKECSINLSEDKTLFVGSNNSGKTSAMHALMFFLGNESKKFQLTDFPIDYWEKLNAFGEIWLKDNIECQRDIDIDNWQKYCPTLELTLSGFKGSDINKITHLIPDLSWNEQSVLSVRLIYQPKDLDELKESFIKTIKQTQELTGLLTAEEKDKIHLPLPNSMQDFLREKLHNFFSIQAFIFSGTELKPISRQPFSGIFKLSIIPAQRGFTDSTDSNRSINNLSDQLGEYYKKHLNPKTLPDENDLLALKEISQLQATLTARLQEGFEEAINTLRTLGYPSGGTDPSISLESYIDSSEVIKQNTKVIFELQKGMPSLSEELNGLGYRNLIYIFFKLLSFRDEWQQKGKLSKNMPIEPIHLVLIEEPEAHLHSQVQQVFVRKAYEILNQEVDPDSYTTQLVISTHSSYIAHEVGFDYLHYFKKVTNGTDIPRSEAKDLSHVFSNQHDDKTKKFVSRYLRAVHCDLFFANAVILVEGSSERILLPYFIQENFPQLTSSYISILEINGAHAHRFKPLTKELGIPTLVITDLDAKNTTHGTKVRPEREKKYVSNCANLTKWLDYAPNEPLDNILNLTITDKIKDNSLVVYQKEIEINWQGHKETVIPYTFEDSIMFTNFEIFKNKNIMRDKSGMLKKMHTATQEQSLSDCCEKAFKALNGEKAQMALDILYEFDNTEKISIPNYIQEGLQWLEDTLYPNVEGARNE